MSCDKVDFVKTSLDLLASEYKNSTNLIAHSEIFTKRLEEIQDQYCKLLTERNLDDAIGVQLDKIGEILGQTRPVVDIAQFIFFRYDVIGGGVNPDQGYATLAEPSKGAIYLTLAQDTGGDNILLDDDQYRALLRATTVKNRMRSTPEDLFELLGFLFPDITNIQIVESTQSVTIIFGRELTPLERALVKLEFNPRGRGSPSYLIPRTLCVGYEFAQHDETNPFIYETLAGGPSLLGAGYSTLAQPTVGGIYATLI